MSSTNTVLVYHYRSNNAPVVKHGLDEISQPELDKILEDYPKLQATTKRIPPGAHAVDIYQRDLFTAAQKEEFKDKPNFHSNVAGVSLKNFKQGEHSELVILSDKK